VLCVEEAGDKGKGRLIQEYTSSHALHPTNPKCSQPSSRIGTKFGAGTVIGAFSIDHRGPATHAAVDEGTRPGTTSWFFQQSRSSPQLSA